MTRILAKDSPAGQGFKQIPPGAHFAICNAVIDLGLQPGYQGAKPQRKVYLRWEVQDERVEYTKDGRTVEGPMSIGKQYTLSLNEKASLRADLENWRGRAFTPQELDGFDIAALIGKACQLMIVHAESNGKSYSNVKGVMGVSKDQRDRARTATLENAPILFSVDEWDDQAYALIPQWLRERILARLEPSSAAPTPAADFEDDSIPF
jgi:hypothetical protein